MKRSVCSQLMFVILVVLQSQKLLTNSHVSEYSEQRVHVYEQQHHQLQLQHQQQQHHHHHLQSNQQSPHQEIQQHPPQYLTHHHNTHHHNRRHHHSQPQQQQAQDHLPYPDKQQQHQPHPQQYVHQEQQNKQTIDELYHRSSYASNMQQVLMEHSVQSYHYAHHVGWNHETTHESASELLAYVNNYETAYPVVQQVNQLSFYEFYHYQRKSNEHPSRIYDDHNFDDEIASRPRESCEPRPNMWQANFQQPTCQNEPTTSVVSNHGVAGSSRNSNVESYPLTSPQYHYESSLIGAIRHYWREVSGLCLASAIFLNWLFVVIKRSLNRADHTIESVRHSTSKSVSKDANSSSAQDSAFEETASPISLEDTESSNSSSNQLPQIRQRSSTLRAEPILIPTKSPGHNSISTSLSNSLNTSEYNSRYSSDFDSIQRLGRGGFGIVFEARNRIDDCHYAVKRICLPLEKEARERVMREVRALAKLDHAGIVRYYNAWLETPPDEWLKQHDAQLGIVHSKDGLNHPSTDGIYERNESEQIMKGSNGKFGENGDNSSGVFRFGKYLKNNSSSPSLDIIFEGSGSIRLESKNNTERTDSMLLESDYGDNISDSEDFIQIKTKDSVSSQLSDPFSSSSDDEQEEDEEDQDQESSSSNRGRKRTDTFKPALVHQEELRERQLNQASMVENSHGEKIYLYIQMQLCRKDTLKDWLNTNCEQRDKTIIFDLFYQIVDAVEYVHSQDLIHRDLKPSNIFFSLDGTLKIGDFGLCRAKTGATIGSSLDLQEYAAESDVERNFEAVHTEQVGTQLYMSPEQMGGTSYNQKVDIFAMGLILMELLVPFKTQMQRVHVLYKARNNTYSEEFKIKHPREYQLVRTLLNRDSTKRPTATEIKQHELLASAQDSYTERVYHRRRTISSNSSTE